MLKNLRRVHFPRELQTSGPIIPAHLLNHVASHVEIVAKAEETAASIRQRAEMEATQIRETARERMAASIHADLNALKELTRQKEQGLLAKSSTICTEICKAVFDQMIDDMAPHQKIEVLVDKLLKVQHHGRELLICCHTSQLSMVEAEVSRVMAEQLNLKKWAVKPRENLSPFEVMISTSNGAEIRVCLDNLKAIYKEEIEALGRELETVMHFSEDDNETIS